MTKRPQTPPPQTMAQLRDDTPVDVARDRVAVQLQRRGLSRYAARHHVASMTLEECDAAMKRMADQPLGITTDDTGPQGVIVHKAPKTDDTDDTDTPDAT